MQDQFKLPDIGEGVAEGEILKWMVKEGEKVSEDQSLVEVMTDKVNVQIPSPKKGAISKLLAKEGDVVKVGQGLVVIDVEGSDGEDGGSPPPPSSSPQPQQAPSSSSRVAEPPGGSPRPQAGVSPPQTAAASADKVLATPATRRLARELGLDITQIRGTGPIGRRHRRRCEEGEGERWHPGRGRETFAVRSSSDRDRPLADNTIRRSSISDTHPTAPVHADDERIPIRGIRKAVSERMTKSVNSIPHVTHVEEVDVTELVLLREALKGEREKREVKLTYLPLIIKAVIPALRRFPYINASLDEKSGDIILKKRYNIGIATDTEQGLVVPVVKDADSKDIFELSTEIGRLAEKGRAGQLTLDEVPVGRPSR